MKYCQENHCDLVKLNPLYQDLAIVLEMCRMFLSSSSVSQSDSNKNNFCLLLPMEVVFEEFIFGIIETNFEDRKPNAQGTGFLTEERVFQIKNDIILQEPKLVIDTKYKIRDKKDSKKGISQTDMYQMLAYSIRREIDQVLLIYPKKNGEEKSEMDIFTIADRFASDKLINIKAADIDICCGEEEIIEQIKNVLASD